MASTAKRAKADFVSLRDAFVALSDVLRLNGRVSTTSSGVKFSNLPRDVWRRLQPAATQDGEMVKALIQGGGRKSSASSRREVVLSVIAVGAGPERTFEVAALLVEGRGPVRDSISLSGATPSWREDLRSFVDWERVDGVIAAAEGNNQRAMIGLVLQLAGIGRGKLEMIEAELPQEIDEAAQWVKGADWLKAGLPRFRSAAGEALWYLMRIRAVHARMIRVRRQGYYTSMALASMKASGMDMDRIAEATGMSEAFVDKLTPTGPEGGGRRRLGVLGATFEQLEEASKGRDLYCADRVWKGAAIFTHVLDRRIRVGAEARRRISDGDDLVSIGDDLRIARRDLVRVLSSRQEELREERDRFVEAVVDPGLVRDLVG